MANADAVLASSAELSQQHQQLSRAYLRCPVQGRFDSDTIDEYVSLSCCHPCGGSSRDHPGWRAASLRSTLNWLDRHCRCGRQHIVYDPHRLLKLMPFASGVKKRKPGRRKKKP